MGVHHNKMKKIIVFKLHLSTPWCKIIQKQHVVCVHPLKCLVSDELKFKLITFRTNIASVSTKIRKPVFSLALLRVS